MHRASRVGSLTAHAQTEVATFQGETFAWAHGTSADTGIVMAAVQQNSSTLQYASAELRGDREFIRAAVQSDDKKAQLVGGIR